MQAEHREFYSAAPIVTVLALVRLGLGRLGLALLQTRSRTEAHITAYEFWADSGLLHDRVCLDETFPMGPCSTSGDQNLLRYDLGPHHCDCHVSTQ